MTPSGRNNTTMGPDGRPLDGYAAGGFGANGQWSQNPGQSAAPPADASSRISAVQNAAPSFSNQQQAQPNSDAQSQYQAQLGAMQGRSFAPSSTPAPAFGRSDQSPQGSTPAPENPQRQQFVNGGNTQPEQQQTTPSFRTIGRPYGTQAPQPEPLPTPAPRDLTYGDQAQPNQVDPLNAPSTTPSLLAPKNPPLRSR